MPKPLDALAPPIKKYVQLLITVEHGPKVAPAEVLPLPKQEIAQALSTAYASASDDSLRNLLQASYQGLTRFSVRGSDPRGDPVWDAARHTFLSTVPGMPSLGALFVGLWLGLRHGEWWWLAIPPVMFVAGSIVIALKIGRPMGNNFVVILATSLFGLVAVVAYASIWIRLVWGEIILGGLALLRSFDVGAALALVFSVVLGYQFSKSVNTFHYFLVSAPWNGQGSTEIPGEPEPTTAPS